VAENLAFPLKNRRLSRAAIECRVTEIAARLDLTGVLNRRARGLTADAKQKISLGHGLVRSDVSAVLFDEPLTVIDPALKWELKAVHRALDLLMIYLTYDQIEALTFADNVVMMNEGKAVQIGTPDNLFERPEHTFVGYFIGSPGMNLMPAKVSGSRALVDGAELHWAQSTRSRRKADMCRLASGPTTPNCLAWPACPSRCAASPISAASGSPMSFWADSRSSPRYRPRCLRSAIRRKLCSIRGARTFTWTTFASRERQHGRKPINNHAWFFVLPV
jgi:hypothetical protein